MKTLTGLALGAIALGAVAFAAPQQTVAQGMGKLMEEIKAKVSNAEHAAVIHERRSAMRAMGGASKKIGEYVKEGKGSPAEVEAEAKKIAAIAEKIPGLFPAGTEMTAYADVTGAKPEIWSKSAEFKKDAELLASLAMTVAKVAAADGADQKTIAAAFGPMGKDGCGTCHKTFRQKLN